VLQKVHMQTSVMWERPENCQMNDHMTGMYVLKLYMLCTCDMHSFSDWWDNKRNYILIAMNTLFAFSEIRFCSTLLKQQG
jgi:hypothetical protein